MMGFKPDSTVRHYLACIPTLTLGIMGRCVITVATCRHTYSSSALQSLETPNNTLINVVTIFVRSAVLPVSSAFASTGIVAGFVIMLVVASANAYTCDLLLWQAYKTGMHDYESLSNAVGGRVWQVRPA